MDGLTHSSLSQYLVLKAKVEESNRLAVETYRSHSRTREADSDDLIVVDMPDTLLVTTRARSQEVKRLVKKCREAGWKQLL